MLTLGGATWHIVCERLLSQLLQPFFFYKFTARIQCLLQITACSKKNKLLHVVVSHFSYKDNFRKEEGGVCPSY